MNEELTRKLRGEMVSRQLIPRGIMDKNVLNAMRKVPRHRFLPKNMEEFAYEDNALPIGEGQTISQPYMVAIMTELLSLTGSSKVLEIGTGSGYQAAVLAEIAKQVYTVEAVKTLADKAGKLLNDIGYKNIKVLPGDGTEGSIEFAPYDAIIVTAAAPDIPHPLIEQLKDKGKLVIPVGDIYSQILKVVTKNGKDINISDSIGCVFVPLVGKYGWKES